MSAAAVFASLPLLPPLAPAAGEVARFYGHCGLNRHHPHGHLVLASKYPDLETGHPRFRALKVAPYLGQG
jgi:hypothetical protein